MNRFQGTILQILYKKKATNELFSMSVNELADIFTDYKYNTIHKALKEMQDDGMIALGCKDRRRLTYWITESGIELLRSIGGKID